MNVFILKIIALITMIIDHYGAIFQPEQMIFRIIGRFAFPIYCFLLIEGYSHTKNIKSYAKRLLIFALISEIPFDLAFYNKINFYSQNVFFTLFIGLMAIYFIENSKNYINIKKNHIITLALLAAFAFSVDYNIIGIIYILAFYFTKNYDPRKKYLYLAISLGAANLLATPIQQVSLLSLPIIHFYNNEYGPKNKLLQIFFYVAYPLHLIIFYIINSYVI